MSISDLLDRPIAYHRVFVTLTGTVKGAILLSQAVYWQKRARQADGWWYKTADEWEEETGLTRHELDKARKDCEKYLKTDLRDIPARLYWQIDSAALESDLIAESGKTSLTKSGKLDSRFSSNINMYAENTTETTTHPLSLENKIFAGQPITESDLQSAEVIQQAPLMFEKALGFGGLPWDSSTEWTRFRKFVTEIFRKDRLAFGNYVVWRAGDGKYAGMSNKQIRQNPAAFMDTGWPEFVNRNSTAEVYTGYPKPHAL